MRPARQKCLYRRVFGLIRFCLTSASIVPAGGLVAEVAVPGEDHRHAGLVAGLDHLAVALRAARLDHRRRAGLDRRLRAVGEGEEGVGGDRRALQQRRRPRRRAPRGTSRSRAAPSRPGSSARRRSRASRRPWRARSRSSARGGTTVQANSRSRHCASSGSVLVTTSISSRGSGSPSRSWTSSPPRTRLTSRSPRVGGRALLVGEDPDRLLLLQHLERVLLVAGRDQHLDEVLVQRLGQRLVDRAVERDHAAERRHRVAGERLLVGLAARRRRSPPRRGCCA